MNAYKVTTIQTVLGVKPDGIWGPKSQAALDEAIGLPVRRVLASSFADPVDVELFRRCKAKGGSDQECFKVGDNGVGKWGDDTTVDAPMCALPPEDWRPYGDAARGKRVLVKANGCEVVCELRDTMPKRENITNGAGIDLNPAACRALGVKPPMMIAATWQWA